MSHAQKIYGAGTSKLIQAHIKLILELAQSNV